MEKLYYLISAILLYLIITACNPSYYSSLNEECKEFINTIDTIWTKNQEGYYSFQFEDSKGYGKFVHNINSCLSGISSKQLVDLFEEPNVIEGNNYIYFMTSPCLTRSRDCNVQSFTVRDSKLVAASVIRPWGYTNQ